MPWMPSGWCDLAEEAVLVGGAAKIGYAICSSPRSGSTFLAYLLLSTGVLGLPSEWLRGDDGPASSRYETYPSDPKAQLAFVLRDGVTPNGVYGLKMFPEHFDTTTESRWTEALPRLHYVDLVRRDLLGQAVSLSIARQTDSYGVWTPECREPVYDRDHIRRCLHFIALGEARWRLFYAANDIRPLQLVYEEVTADPQGAVDNVARLLGVEGARIVLG